MTFTAFRSMDDPMLMAWARFRQPFAIRSSAAPQDRPSPRQVAARPTVGAAPGRPEARSGLWRLLATNNRELGRSFHLYSSVEAARAHVERLQGDGANLEIDIVPGPLSSSRGWIITHEGSPVMTSSRWYDSSSTGADAAVGALAAFARAIVSADVDRGALRRTSIRRGPVGAPADA
ncbi:hypothetical protein [Agromyces bauzanensis]